MAPQRCCSQSLAANGREYVFSTSILLDTLGLTAHNLSGAIVIRSSTSRVNCVAAVTSSLTVTWDDASSDDHDGFTLQRKIGTTGTYAPLTTLGMTARSYIDTSVSAATVYCYQVASYNEAGSSGESNEACATAPTPLMSSLSVTTAGSGTVTSSPSGITCGSTCSASFASGTSIALSATPSAGYSFTGWSGACTGTGACTLILNQNQTLAATFAVIPPASYALSVVRAGAGSGTVTSSPSGITCGSTCSASFASGTSVSLTATPAAGSSFTGWSGACTGTGACTVAVTQASSVTATFAVTPPASYALSVVRAGAGSGTVTSSPSGITCGSTCSASFASGTSVSLTATPAAGSSFTGWSGACTGTGACTVAVTQASSVTATFAVTPPASYALSVVRAGAGSGTVTSSPSGITCGSTCGARASPAARASA